MSGFDVATWQVEGTAARLAEIADELDAVLRGVEVAASVALDGWRGEVAALVLSRWERWHHGATEMIAGLRTVAEFLMATGRTYAEAETASVIS